MQVRTTASELARWLGQQGGVWHVEGEPALARSLPLPTPAQSLVEVLGRRNDEIVMLAPDTSAVVEDAPLLAHQLAIAAHVVDGQRVFQLAWMRPDGTVSDSWLLAEQRAQAARPDSGAAARSVMAAFRAGVTTRRR